MKKSVASFHPESVNYAGIEAISTYNQEGVICLRGAFNQEWLNVVEKGIDQYFRQTPPNGTLLAARLQSNEPVFVTHVIRRGDTLSEIASRYNIGFEDLKRENSLNSNTIRIGQTLRIPQL